MSDDKVRLLFGPYRAPQLKRGERVSCLYRDRLVVVCRITDAPLPWPVCRPVEPPYGGKGLLVDEELARAIRNESVLALCHWWGVGRSTAQRWRGAFGVGRMDSEGSRRLILGAIQISAEARDEGEAEVCGVWTDEEETLLGGTLTDREVAQELGRTLDSVRQHRRRLKLLNPDPRSKPHPGRRWTLEEDGMVARLAAEEAARRTGRTLASVYRRRGKLRAHLGRPRFSPPGGDGPRP